MDKIRAELTALLGELRTATAKASLAARKAWARAHAAMQPGAPERAELAHVLSVSASHARWTVWCMTIALLLAGAGGAIMATPALVAGSIQAMFDARDERRDEAAAMQQRLRESVTELEGVNFIDRFRALDVNRWVLSDGWNNGAYLENDWRAQQISTTHEGMSITLDRSGPGADKIFTSGELQSRESYQYGYFEVRMRVPRGDGLVTGFFTFTRPDGRSSWEEIDIEILGRDTRSMELTYHVHGRARQTIIDLGFDAADDFHVYGIEWTADAIRWYVDGQMVHEARGGRVQDMRRRQRLYLQLWNTAELYRWAGHINPEEAPWVLSVTCMAQAREYRGQSLCADRPQERSLRGR